MLSKALKNIKHYHINLLTCYNDCTSLDFTNTAPPRLASLAIAEESDMPDLESDYPLKYMHRCRPHRHAMPGSKINVNWLRSCTPGKPWHTDLEQLCITLLDWNPIRCQPYTLPHATVADVAVEVYKMLHNIIIEPSNSPYAVPIVLVRKKMKNRFCVYYRRLMKSPSATGCLVYANVIEWAVRWFN